MALSALILAVSLAAPELSPENHDALSRGFPQRAGRQRDSAASVIEAAITPHGDIRSCKVVAVVGDQRSGNRVCELISKQKARPAVGPDGQPVHGRLLTVLQLIATGSSNAAEVSAMALTPDIQLAVAGLPPEAGSGLDLGLNLMVDASGTVSHCELPAPDSTAASAAAGMAGGRGRGAGLRPPPAPPKVKLSADGYAPAVCKHIKQLPLETLSDDQGKPVAYVRRVFVRLTPSTAAPAR